MSKYTKKPVTIEAVQFDGTEESVEAVLKFMQGDHPDLSHLPNPDGYVTPGVGYCPPVGELYIPTLEGNMTASPGDWIIKGVNGEFYPCKPDIFEATYTLAKQALVSVSKTADPAISVSGPEVKRLVERLRATPHAKTCDTHKMVTQADECDVCCPVVFHNQIADALESLATKEGGTE